jgi:hypothetical protein
MRKNFCLLNFLLEWLGPVCFHLLAETDWKVEYMFLNDDIDFIS